MDFLLREPVRPFEFRLSVHEPGVCGLPPVKSLRFAVNDSAGFLDNYLGGKSL